MRPRRRALAFLALLACAPFVAACRGARAPESARRVVVVGLDGADWELLDGYLKAGAMPQLARLVAEGRRAGRLGPSRHRAPPDRKSVV